MNSGNSIVSEKTLNNIFKKVVKISPTKPANITNDLQPRLLKQTWRVKKIWKN